MKIELLTDRIQEMFKSGCGHFVASDINRKGMFVGETSSPWDNENKWRPWALIFNGEPQVPLQLQDFNLRSRAYSINDNGEVVGSMQRFGEEKTTPFYYHNGELLQLPVPRESIETIATHINNNGLIAGTYRPRSRRGGIDFPRTCVWKKDEGFKPTTLDLEGEIGEAIAKAKVVYQGTEKRDFITTEPQYVNDNDEVLFDLCRVGGNLESYPMVWKNGVYRPLFREDWGKCPVVDSVVLTEDGKSAGQQHTQWSAVAGSWFSKEGSYTELDYTSIRGVSARGMLGNMIVGNGQRLDLSFIGTYWNNPDSRIGTMDDWLTPQCHGWFQHVWCAKDDHMIVSGYVKGENQWRVSIDKK